MQGPILSVGMWSSDVAAEELIRQACVHLAAKGALISQTRVDFAAVHNFAPFSFSCDDAILEEMSPKNAQGHLISLSVGDAQLDIETDETIQSFRDALISLVLSVRPDIATVAVEDPPDELPDPSWPEASSQLRVGWIDLERCTPERRERFQALYERKLAVSLESGLWWSEWDLLSLVRDQESHPTNTISAAVFEAWTGERVPEATNVELPTPSAEDLAPRQLWFWSATDTSNALLTRAAKQLANRGLDLDIHDFGQHEPWGVVVAQFLPQGRSVEALLDDLRAGLPGIHPSWAGVQPQSGFIMPGPDANPDTAFLSMITHPWVSRDWIGDELPNLEAALAGCHREDVADGVLWITSPDLAPDSRFSEDWYDSDAQFRRMTSAAEILGRAARRSLGMAP